MMSERPEALRLQAARCRRLAPGAQTIEVRRMLERMAQDFDSRAAELEHEEAVRRRTRRST
jgi:hypothetical protein